MSARIPQAFIYVALSLVLSCVNAHTAGMIEGTNHRICEADVHTPNSYIPSPADIHMSTRASPSRFVKIISLAAKIVVCSMASFFMLLVCCHVFFFCCFLIGMRRDIAAANSRSEDFTAESLLSDGNYGSIISCDGTIEEDHVTV